MVLTDRSVTGWMKEGPTWQVQVIYCRGHVLSTSHYGKLSPDRMTMIEGLFCPERWMISTQEWYEDLNPKKVAIDSSHYTVLSQQSFYRNNWLTNVGKAHSQGMKHPTAFWNTVYCNKESYLYAVNAFWKISVVLHVRVVYDWWSDGELSHFAHPQLALCTFPVVFNELKVFILYSQ